MTDAEGSGRAFGNGVSLRKRARILTETQRKSATNLPHVDGEFVSGSYRYYDWVLDALAGHGLIPTDRTPPSALRDAVSDLYRYEIRRLRRSLLEGRILKPDYANHVIALRKRYLLLSVPVERWLIPGHENR